MNKYKISILILLATSQSIAFLDRVNLSVVVPHLIKDHHFTASSAGALMSVFNVAYMLAILFAGPLTDAIKPRRAYPAALALWSAATAACGFTVRFIPFAICRVFVGIGEAPMIPAGANVINHTYEKSNRAKAVSYFFSGNKVGLALGIPLSSLILVKLGIPWVFYITGMLGIVWLIAWKLIYKPPVKDTEDAPKREKPIKWLSLFKYRATWGVVIGQAGYLYAYYFFVAWLPGYLTMQRHLPVLKAGLLGMLPFVVGIAGTLLGGWLSDRMVARGTATSAARKLFSVGGLLLATGFIMAGAFTPNTYVAVTFIILAVGGMGVATATVNSTSIDLAPKDKVSSFVSLQNFGGNVGGALAPIVTGFLVSATGNFITAFVVTALVVLVFGCGGYGLIIREQDHVGGGIDRTASDENASLAPNAHA